MHQLTGQDASFVYGETPNTPMHGSALCIYDPTTAPGGQVRFKDLLAHLESRLHLAPVFRDKLVRVPMDVDHPYWVHDQSFDLEYHVRHTALPKPGDWRQLCIQVARLHARSLDMTRPLWELDVIEGLDNVEGYPPGCFAVLLKTHHAAIDGSSGRELTAAMHDETAVAGPVAPPPATEPDPEPAPWELLARASMNHYTMPMRFAEMMAHTYPHAARVQSWTPGIDYQVPTPAKLARTRFNGTITAHRVYDAFRTRLDDLRVLRSLVPGATVNDVVLAVISGGLRAYLHDHGELPAESLVTGMPVAVRDPSDTTMQGNRLAAMTASLATNVPHPVERLAAIRAATSQSKVVLEAVGARQLVELAQFLPGGLMALSARLSAELELANTVDPVINTIVSNVPGIQVPLYFAGSRLLANYGMPPLNHGTGLIHLVSGYCGELYFNVISCREMLPDPAHYVECLRGALAELQAAA